VSDSRSDDVAPDEAVADEVVGGDDVVDGEPPPDQAQAETVTVEPVSVPVQPVDTGYTPGGVPTFDSVREKIETRYGTAIGAAELAAETPEGRTVEEQYDARQRAAAERLEQIRASMHDDESGQA
jgi:phage shock protein A